MDKGVLIPVIYMSSNFINVHILSIRSHLIKGMLTSLPLRSPRGPSAAALADKCPENAN